LIRHPVTGLAWDTVFYRWNKIDRTLIRISQVIVRGTIKNPGDYRITSGNPWLSDPANLGVVHPGLFTETSFVINWKNGHIARWSHDFELSTDWHLGDVTIEYTDHKGNTVLKIHPTDFRFHYNISRDGIIKNWKEHKKGFISLLKWSLDNIVE